VWLIVGLGNPGEEYAKTRHNIGFQVVNELARRYSLDFGKKLAKSRVAEGQIAGQRAALAKPFTYMNVIGQAIVSLGQWYKIAPAQELLIIYDELDLPFGTLRLRERGSAGTHNGMKSVVGQLGSQVFPRLRIGIGQGPPGRDAASYVLGRFTREEQEQIPEIIARAADAAEVVLREGLIAAMNRYNAPEKKQSDTEQGRKSS
jgi:PTH1 family peptidyl-tRNA hydrolase